MNVRTEFALVARDHTATNAAAFLGQAAPADAAARSDLLTANVALPRHDLLQQFGAQRVEVELSPSRCELGQNGVTNLIRRKLFGFRFLSLLFLSHIDVQNIAAFDFGVAFAQSL